MFKGTTFCLIALLLINPSDILSAAITESNKHIAANRQSDLCDSKYASNLASNQVNDVRATRFASQLFQWSDKYCLILGYSSVKEVASFGNGNDYRTFFERYEQAYSSLNTLDEKAAFIDLFLYNVSRRYLTFAKIVDSSNEARVTFSFKNKNQHIRRISLNLFNEENDAIKTLLLNKLNMLSTKSEIDITLSNLVNYVLHPNSGNSVYNSGN